MSTSRIQNPENVIQVDNLSKSYGNVTAVNDMSFCVKKGEMFTENPEASIAAVSAYLNAPAQ